MNRYFGDYPGVFDSEQIGVMSKALNDALTTAQASGAPYATEDNADRARMALAKSIIAAALDGEFDVRKLRSGALADLVSANRI